MDTFQVWYVEQDAVRRKWDRRGGSMVFLGSVIGEGQKSSVKSKVWTNPRTGRERSFGVIHSLFSEVWENSTHTVVVKTVDLI